MEDSPGKLNVEVTHFLEALKHPLLPEIMALRAIILQANTELTENIKWNGPNYSLGDDDRITMKIHPPKQIQIIFHRGVKKQEQPKDRIIEDESGLLQWKEKDRAVAAFRNRTEIDKNQLHLSKIVMEWIKATQ